MEFWQLVQLRRVRFGGSVLLSFLVFALCFLFQYKRVWLCYNEYFCLLEVFDVQDCI